MAFQVRYLNCSAELQLQVSQIIEAWNNNHQTFELKTSGSTGTPKIVFHDRERLFNSASRTNSFFKLNENSSVLLAISPQFVGGMMLVIRAMIGNYRLTVTEPSKIDELDKSEIFDFASLVPIQIEKIRIRNTINLKQFKTILLGGTSLSNPLCDFIQKEHSNCYIGFGMTETVSHIALRKISDTFYSCLEGVTVEEKNGQLIVHDKLLQISNFITSDEVKVLDKNRFIWLGRTDFIINSGGIKFHPEPIEEYIRNFISGDYILAGIQDEILGEKCVLILETNSLLNVPFSEIQHMVGQQFGKYTPPKSFLHANFHYSENGKILRKLTIRSLNESS